MTSVVGSLLGVTTLMTSCRGERAGAPAVEASPAMAARVSCLGERAADTVVVSSAAALESAVNAAPPGRNILIAPGPYSGGTLTFNRDGTEASPIIIRPQNGPGTVTIDNADWTLANTSSWLVIEDIYFEASRVLMCGDHNRVSRCRFRNINRIAIQVNDPDDAHQGARNCRIDHCDFSDMTADTTCIHLRTSHWGTGSASTLLVDHNYIHDIPDLPTSGEQAVLNNFANLPTLDLEIGSNLIWEHNLVENVRLGSSSELLTTKIGGMIIRYSTFVNCTGEYLQPRAAAFMEWRSNWFENIGSTALHLWGPDNLAIGNRFVGAVDLWVPAGNGNFADVKSGAAPLKTYAPATNNRVIGNRMDSGHILVGAYWSRGTPSVPADNNLLEANTRDSGGDAHTLLVSHNGVSPVQLNTTVNATTSEPFTPAVKLTASDVGLNAADPLCAQR
jgi:chondroitinase B-like protein